MEKCPNCSTELASHFAYCTHCGQKTHLPRFRIRHILDEFVQAFFSVDKGVLFLTKNLALRPGVTAREYVLEGKRRKYFNPFSFLLIVLGLNLSVNVLVKPYTNGHAAQKLATQPLNPNTPKELLPYIERQRKATAFVEENINMVGLLAIPVFALVFYLFFRRNGINYSEHMIALIFFVSFFSLVTIVLTLTLGFLLNQYLPYLNRLLLLFQLIYLTIAYYQFLDYKQPVNYLKTGVATTLALMAWFAASAGAFYLYIRYGD